jgi:hypothetical protein
MGRFVSMCAGSRRSHHGFRHHIGYRHSDPARHDGRRHRPIALKPSATLSLPTLKPCMLASIVRGRCLGIAAFCCVPAYEFQVWNVIRRRGSCPTAPHKVVAAERFSTLLRLRILSKAPAREELHGSPIDECTRTPRILRDIAMHA